MIRLRDRVLPPPETAELPPPVRLRSMLGPGIILLGLSVGSGEFVLWPRLTSEWGFAVFWAAMVGVTIQFFLNMEIERYTLATGESAVTGFFRLGRLFGPVFLVCAVVPWIWPGWATGAAEILSWEIGPDWGSPRVFAVVGLVGCGLVLSLGPVVYRTVESIQLVLVSMIFVLLIVLVCLVVRADSIRAMFEGLGNFGNIPDGIDMPMLLGALAFAGAGGTANLAQSNYIKDKGYGMGKWIGRITSPLTGQDEAVSDVGCVFEPTQENLARWRVWWRRANIEHALSFYLLCGLSLAFFCLVTHALLGEGSVVPEGLGFVQMQAEQLEQRFGPGTAHLFLWTGIIVLLTTEVGILDAVTRVASDVIKLSFLRDRDAWTNSRIYFVVLWAIIACGVVILLLPADWSDQPLVLLVISASLNAVVMFLYSGLLLWLGTTSFSGPLRPSPVRIAALCVSLAFFGYFSYITVVDRIWG